MMRLRVLRQVTLMTFREFIRTPGSVFWTYGFPLLMAIALGFAFRSTEKPELPIGVVAADLAVGQVDALRANPRLKTRVLDLDTALEQFRRGRLLLVVTAGAAADGLPQVRLDPTRPEAEVARLQVERTLTVFLHGGRSESGANIETIDETTPGWRYIDWLIPGLIGLNLLGAGMWGVGFNLVQMRVKNILRRLMVTPMHRSEFLVAFLFSRLILVVPEAAAVIGFGVWAFGVPVVGSLWLILLLVVLGATSFVGLGMLIASRVESIEVVSGMMNLIMMPMWLLGGCFFSSDRFPEFVQTWLVTPLPITHLNNALRAVMSDGAGFVEVAGEIGYLAAFTVITLGLSIRCFRWT